MKVVYNKKVNIDLGILNFIRPFDGTKFRKAITEISSDAELLSPIQALSLDIDDVPTRERLAYDPTKVHGIPTVFTIEGGIQKIAGRRFRPR